MLPEIGATELLVIAAVALIVVGPKDLPLLLRKLGQWVAKARGMANEFRASFDEMARQSELDELRKEVQALRTGQFSDPFQQASDDAAANASVEQVFADIDAGLKGGEIQAHPPMSYQYDTPSAPEAAPKPKRQRAPAKPKAEAAPAAKASAKKAAAKKAPAARATPAKVAVPAAKPRKKKTEIVS